MRRLVEVASGVLVATSRVMSTTSTVIAADGEALLVDPAWLPDELDGLAAELRRRRLAVVGGFATHAHHDHVLWHPDFGDAPRWASSDTARLARDEREALVTALGEGFAADLAALVGRVESAPGARVEAPGGRTVELIVHDGHAPGHTALWLPEPRVLIAGDMLSDVELPLPFDPDDLPSYLAALEILAPFAARAEIVIPGHGAPGGDALVRLDADRRYLDVVAAGGVPDDPRLANPGMRDEYAHLVRMVRGRGSG